MTNPRRTHGIYRFFVIALVLAFLSALFAVSAALASIVEPQLSTGSVLILGALAMTTLASSVLVNTIPTLVMTVWRWPQAANTDLVEVVGWLRTLWRPSRLIGVALVATAVVGAGILLRPPPADLENGPLTVMTAFGDSPSDPRSMLRDQWNQLHPDNPARFDYAPGEPDQQHERMVGDARPGGERKADIYVLDIVWLEEFIRRGHIQPLDLTSFADADLGDFIPKVREPAERDGELWALPFNTDVGLMFYRTDIPGVGKPARWDDYLGPPAATALAAAKRANLPVEAANAAQLADEEVLTIAALEAIWAAGGNVVSPDGQVLRTSDNKRVHFDNADRRGIENLARAAKDPSIVLTAEATQAKEGEAIEAFNRGRTLYMRNWPVSYDQIDPELDFGVAAPPTPSVLGGQYLAISAGTKRPRAAHALIEFLTSPASQLVLSEVGGFAPTRRSAFDNAKRPYSQEVQAALNSARLRPVTPCYTEFSQLFRKGIARALNADGKLEEQFPEELATTLACA